MEAVYFLGKIKILQVKLDSLLNANLNSDFSLAFGSKLEVRTDNI